MKIRIIILTISFFFITAISCRNTEVRQDVQSTISSSEYSVYYFHFTRRCATCLAVEENAKKALETLYPVGVKSGEYAFASLNLDEPSTKALAEKYSIGGQTLIVVHGDKKIDITDKGFLNARDSVRMQEEIKAAIEKVQF